MTDVVLKNATIISPSSGNIAEDKCILITEGKIEKITTGSVSDKSTIDLKGKFVLPGLIDAHVHVNAISANLNQLRYQPQSYVVPQAIKIMEGMLMRGFTTVRDAAGADWGLAKAIEEGHIKAPRLIFGGPALSPTGGHGDSRSAGDFTGYNPHGSSLSLVCDGVSEVRKACRDIIRSGGRHIKIMASGGVASPTDRIDSLQFSAEEIRAIVEEAEAANIYVLAHAYSPKAVNRALRLGVRSIEHANLLDEESISLFVKYDAFLVPTLVTYYALEEDGLELGLPRDSYDKIAAVLSKGKQSVKLAYQGGVRMAYGTDLLGKMHARQLEEFRILGEIMPNLNVIQTATTNAASLLNLKGKIGEIVEGAFADLLVYDENPLVRLEVLQEPDKHLQLIMKQGKIHKNTMQQNAI